MRQDHQGDGADDGLQRVASSMVSCAKAIKETALMTAGARVAGDDTCSLMVLAHETIKKMSP